MTDDHFKRTVLQALHELRNQVAECQHVQRVLVDASKARCRALADLMQAVNQRNRKLDELSESLQRAFDSESDSWWKEGRDPFGDN